MRCSSFSSHSTKTSSPVSPIRPPCTSAVCASAPAPALVQPYLPASNHRTGAFARCCCDQRHILTPFAFVVPRFLIWIGQSHVNIWPENQLTTLCLLIGSDQEKTFGPTISGLIHRNIEPERLLLWDSKVRFRE